MCTKVCYVFHVQPELEAAGRTRWTTVTPAGLQERPQKGVCTNLSQDEEVAGLGEGADGRGATAVAQKPNLPKVGTFLQYCHHQPIHLHLCTLFFKQDACILQ